jgi:triosephosphate isomerase
VGHHSEDNVRQLIAGNWKMNGLMPQLAEIEAVAASVTAKLPPANVLICTPATLITPLSVLFQGKLNHHWPPEHRTSDDQCRRLV